jgi:hypothetical protein
MVENLFAIEFVYGFLSRSSFGIFNKTIVEAGLLTILLRYQSNFSKSNREDIQIQSQNTLGYIHT